MASVVLRMPGPAFSLLISTRPAREKMLRFLDGLTLGLENGEDKANVLRLILVMTLDLTAVSWVRPESATQSTA
jgi:hypothetical protein